MAKVYFISVYRQVRDPEKLAAYAKLAGPAIEAAVAQVTAMYESPAYQRALTALGDGAVRDIRVIEGV